MRNPAEISVFKDLKSSTRERLGVLLERREVALAGRPCCFVAKTGSKHWEFVIHVDHDAHTARHEKLVDSSGAVLAFAQTIRIPKGVDTENEMKRTANLFRTYVQGCCEIGADGFVSCH